MPYITKAQRLGLTPITDAPAYGPGSLNYQITCLIIDYVNRNGLNYQRINDVVGALDSAKLEFYRRVAAPYEDNKIKQNGDVYDGINLAE